MDPVTHVLFGAVCASAVTPPPRAIRNDIRIRMTVAAVAAAFPDIDYLSFWLDPLVFLADWHRTATHSILFMPVWAGLLGSLFMFFRAARERWCLVYCLCALGIASHILLDLLTVFGIRIFYPASESLYSFGTTYVIDLIVTGILAATLICFIHLPKRLIVWGGVAVIITYWGGQWILKSQAHAIATDRKAVVTHVHALPQPFSPFYWKLIRRTENNYEVAYLSLVANEEGLFPLYRGTDALLWRKYTLLGTQDSLRPTIREAWEHPLFNKFRSFAQLPVLYRFDQKEANICVWFTDMRYTLPFIKPAFRYGMCRDADGPWLLYRLKRFTENKRQLLPGAGSSSD